ncbi:MAG: hypothetical protein CVT49_16060 [candidate division Zixibacteria bacterium HGW-Zixibacteria-1]|nr:MAG: hypothetical protein CVT49_16060 [candidate division Zixibacteria bacterium HGW-Zixibacteria-1]
MQDASELEPGPAITDRVSAAGSFLLAAMLAMSVLLAATATHAATITTIQSGNWDVSTTWDGGVPPGPGDDVTIASGHVVTVAADAAAVATMVIAGNTSGINGININPGSLLNVSGAITMTAPTSGTSTLNVGAGTLNAASIAIPGSPTAGRYCVVTVSTGTINVTGAITFTGTPAQARFISTDTSTVNIAGNFESGGTLITSNTGTINFTGSTAQTLGYYTTYNNITINNTSNGVALNGTTTILGSLTVATGTFIVGPYTLTVAGVTNVTGRLSITSATGTKTFTGDVTINSGGSWDNTSGNEAVNMGGSFRNDGTLDAGTGRYTFTGAIKTIDGVNPVSIPNLTVNGTVTNYGTLIVNTALGGSGTLTNGTNATLGIGGTLSITTLDAATTSNTVDYSGTAQTVRAITYHHLTLSGSGTKTLTNVGTIHGDLKLSGMCSATTAITTTIGGSLSVGMGTTFTVAGFNLTIVGETSVSGTLAHSSAAGTKTYVGPVTIDFGGSWTNASNSAIAFHGGLTHNGTTFSSGAGVYIFDTNPQTLEGGSTLTIDNVIVNGITLTNNSTNLIVSTALDGTGELLQGAGATLTLGGTAGITTLDAAAGANTVDYSGAAQTVKPTTYHHLTLSGGGTKTLTNVGTIDGNLTLAGTCSATTAITTTIDGNLSIGTGTIFAVAGFNLTIAGETSVSGTLAHSSAAGTKTYVGPVTIDFGGSWTNASNSAIALHGGLTHNGASFSAGTGIYAFDTNPQTLEGGSTLTINNVTVNGITLTNNSTNLIVSTALNGTGELLQGPGAMLTLGGTVGIITLDAAASANTVNYSGAAQTVKPTTYHHLTLSGGGAKALPSTTLTIYGDFTLSGTAYATAAAAINIAGSLSIGSSASFATGPFTHDLNGGFSNSGTFTASGGGIALTGTTDQSIGGSATTTFNNLTVNKIGGTVMVNTTFNVGGMLTFASGIITTGANIVIITSTGGVSRTSGHVFGNLRKQVSAGSTSQTFEIGDAGSYCPLSVSFSGITSSGDLTARITAGDHPKIESSTIDSIRSVNKYWTLTNSGIVFTNYDASFGFNDGDIDGGANTDLFKVGRYAGDVWTYPVVGVKAATRTEAIALTEFGDFGLGEDRPDPPVLATIGSQSVAEGHTLVVDVSATDPDGDSLTLSAENLPTNAGFSDNGDGTGSFAFSPDFTQAGVYNATFIVSDGALADSEIVAIEVTAVNAYPVLVSIGSQSVAEGDTLVVGVSATDPDGDNLILSAENLPTNASFDDNGDGTGSFAFSPDFTQVGVYNVTFIASDGVLADSEVVVITVVRHDSITISGNAGLSGTTLSYTNEVPPI